MPPSRKSDISRKTSETNIQISLDLDGSGESNISTGIGFFDHMLTHIARHGLFNLKVKADGDLQIDDHHTVEDVGIVLGMAMKQALGDKTGITRVGNIAVPMDEALVFCAIDISGRGHCEYNLSHPTPILGDFTVELAPEFFRALSVNAGWTVHLRQLAGNNTHHILESAFKAFGRAARKAVTLDPRVQGIPSTKGIL